MATAAVLLLPVLTQLAVALLPHPTRETGAPGLYAQYDWPAAAKHALSKDMRVDHTWLVIPPGVATDGNGVFASSQFWLDAYGAPCPNASAHGRACNSAGYMGSQVARGGAGGGERLQFIFSCWDADSAHTVGWTTDGCSRFGGEGTGSHCLLEVPAEPNVTHSFRVRLSRANASGAMWTGTVTNTATGASRLVGTLFFPHLPGRVGFGDLRVQSDDFLEYFAGGDCDGAVATSVGIEGPYFESGAVAPTQAYPAYGAGGCNRSDVQGCIAGRGCGRPRVTLRGGKGVTRTSPDKVPLWPARIDTRL